MFPYWNSNSDVVQSDTETDDRKSNIKSILRLARRERTSVSSADKNQLTEDERIEMYKVRNEDEDSRGNWNHKLDFLFSCISVSVGLGNVWRFPYLCYKHGGGAFLIVYSIVTIFCGVPLFLQEVAIGQYLRVGGMNVVGELVPLLQGVGYATMTIVFFVNVYYCVIIAWTLFYLIASFTYLPGLPWQYCGNWWNTYKCFTTEMDSIAAHNRTKHTTSPVEEFWDRRVLKITDGIDQLGSLQWELFGCLLLGWIIIYLIIRRGIHQSGKIIWFTALFPYFVLLPLLIRAVTLEGAMEGLNYYIKPRWSELQGSTAWLDGATQIFFAFSIGTGALPALGSYNNFHHNCFKDTIITCIINTLTCLVAGCVTFAILGHLALEQELAVGEVVKSGPGLVFLTYPEVVLTLPGAPIWAAIFFSMLVILGIDSEFCIVESFITGCVDHWPDVLRPRRHIFTFLMCLLMFLLGIPMICEGGMYIFQVMDFYSASGMCLLFSCFFQTVAISWIFGASRFADCIREMMGIELNNFWKFSWKFFAPGIMIFIFVFSIIQHVPVTYGFDYTYPDWVQIVGFALSLSSMLWVPLYALYYVLITPTNWRKNLSVGMRPRFQTRNDDATSPGPNVMPLSESSMILVKKR